MMKDARDECDACGGAYENFGLGRHAGAPTNDRSMISLVSSDKEEDGGVRCIGRWWRLRSAGLVRSVLK